MDLFLLSTLTVILILNYCLADDDHKSWFTPPMGWLSWEHFQCNTDCSSDANNCISENLFKQMAEAMIVDGYLEAGYNRINIDDCWMEKHRDGNNALNADKNRFPNGIKHLSDFMHQRGLKLGIYEGIGKKTCMGFPGSFGHLEIDAKTFAEWDVDMVKMDGCLQPPYTLDILYKQFGHFLNATGKSILYSCSWPYYQLHYSKIIPDFAEVSQTCNLWRTYHDIKPDWGILLETIDFYGDFQEVFNRYVRPGTWNDPDMLLIGNPKLSVEESKVQMGIWAILAAPLLMSNDLRSIKPEYRKILLNKEVIAVNQDKLGIPGKRVFHNESFDIWLRELSPETRMNLPSFAFAFVNRRQTSKPQKLSVKLSDFKFDKNYIFIDLFSNAVIGEFSPSDLLSVSVPSKGIRLLKASPIY
ncbi:uncharacterized protein B4U80_06291 [Leptotrombidium deliense]|uniref:Alpha-galactosidase n=1 Tax=Leptotrombidium deliense TaxID=299467 RepID=A0A443S9T5_9ACAR|nr:uncharacterized protein B4U80_06291 [Leptotrombidium deliense]